MLNCVCWIQQSAITTTTTPAVVATLAAAAVVVVVVVQVSHPIAFSRVQFSFASPPPDASHESSLQFSLSNDQYIYQMTNSINLF